MVKRINVNIKEVTLYGAPAEQQDLGQEIERELEWLFTEEPTGPDDDRAAGLAAQIARAIYAEYRR